MTQPFDNEKKFYLKTSFILTRDKRLETRDNFRNRVQLSVNTEKKNIRKKSAKEYSKYNPRKNIRKKVHEKNTRKIIHEEYLSKNLILREKKTRLLKLSRKSAKELSKENPRKNIRKKIREKIYMICFFLDFLSIIFRGFSFK